jgi:hypothetical protein
MTAATWITAGATVVTAVLAGLIYLRQTRGATVSARFEETSEFTGVNTGSKRSYRLVIKNLGPAPIRLISVEAHPDLLAGPVTFDLELLKDEEHRIAAAPSLATPPIVTIKTTWLDSRGNQKSREQALGV